jgi:hypothetical protein
VVAVSRRQGESRSSSRTRVQERDIDYEPRQTYPPVVVISPQGGQPGSGSWGNPWGGRSGGQPSSLRQGGERQFTVVGGAPADTERPWRRDQERH